MGAFPPPVKNAGDTCYISDHADIAIGLNAKSPNQEAAKKFLSWVASPEFASIYANALPGFFSLSSTPVKMEDPLAQEFVSLAREVQADHPLDLPDPVARHAEPGERDLGRVGQRHQRHRHAGSGRQEASGRPRQLVQAG